MFLKQLYYLREIERHQNFSKAAEACNVSQRALSRAIRQLEDELGVVIVDRKKKVFGFTDKGGRVLKWAHDILRSVTELRSEVTMSRQAIAGVIRIGVFLPPVMLPPYCWKKSIRNVKILPARFLFLRMFPLLRCLQTRSSTSESCITISAHSPKRLKFVHYMLSNRYWRPRMRFHCSKGIP